MPMVVIFSVRAACSPADWSNAAMPFVEVTLSGIAGNGIGWDTHGQNFEAVKQLSAVLDPAWASLMSTI